MLVNVYMNLTVNILSMDFILYAASKEKRSERKKEKRTPKTTIHALDLHFEYTYNVDNRMIYEFFRRTCYRLVNIHDKSAKFG